MSYLRYFCLFAYGGVQHILCWFLVFFVLYIPCCQFLWIGHFRLPLRCSLTFIHKCVGAKLRRESAITGRY
jgi:hypothetical protein